MTGVSRMRQVLLAMVALLAAAGPGLARATTTPQAPALTDRVTVAGKGASYATVRLLDRLDFRRSTAPKITASHLDRLDGLVLIRVVSGSSAPGVAFLNLHSGTLLTSAYAFLGTDNGDQVSGTPVFVKRTLEPGTYRLLLLSRGDNSVTITLPGSRRGETRVTANTPTRYAAREISGTGVSSTAIAPVVTSATTFHAQTRPVQLGLAWLKSTSAATRFHACATASPDATDEAAADTPYCLAMAGINNFAAGVARVDIYQAFYQPASGTWQFKTVVTAAGIASDGGVLSMQVELGPGYPLA
jgi:hypothetical protein